MFYWTEIWDEQRGLRLLIPVGLLAGYAYAAKYTAFPIGIYALGFVAWRSRRLRPLGKSLRPVLVVAGCALIMAGPWIARNWIWYQNPLAPFGNWLFRNPYVHVIFEQDYAEFLRTLRDAEPADCCRWRRPSAGNISTGSSDRHFCCCPWR